MVPLLVEIECKKEKGGAREIKEKKGGERDK